MEILIPIGLFFVFLFVVGLVAELKEKGETYSPALKQSMINTRINAMAKELRGYLLDINLEDPAYLLVQATRYRLSLSSNPVNKKAAQILKAPQLFSKEECYEIYWVLEDIYINLREKRKNKFAEGAQWANDTAKRMALIENSCRLWMVTIGAVINPASKDEAQDVWNLLIDSYPYIEDAIALIKMEDKVSSGLHSGDTDNTDYEFLKKEAYFVPEIFKQNTVSLSVGD